MTLNKNLAASKNYHALFFGAVAIIITLMLAYIDEGNYSFAGLLSASALFAMVFYIGLLFFPQFALYYLSTLVIPARLRWISAVTIAGSLTYVVLGFVF